MDELRAVTAYAVACAEPVLHLFDQACSQDRRPATAMDAARAFAEGGRRSRRQRTAATDAHRAGREAASEAARHAALAAGDACASAYLHPLAKATQLRHILGAAAHAARAGELARGDDPVVAHYLLDAAAKRATATVRDALGRSRAHPMHGPGWQCSWASSTACCDPPPPPRPVDDPGPFYHDQGRPPPGRPPHARLAVQLRVGEGGPAHLPDREP